MGDNHVRALPPLEAFSARYLAEPMSGCWLWEGAVFNHGYGVFQSKHGGKRWVTTAHRASWILHNGPIPAGMIVCHKCDNPMCVNPDHLFIGTDKDNVHDAIRKGRFQSAANPFYQKGSARRNALLNEQDVRDIRVMREVGMSCRLVAAEYGVSTACIERVDSRRSWRHVN